jgi:hypothetical protein
VIIEATNKVLLQAGPHGHILNVGHGVVQVTRIIKSSKIDDDSHNGALKMQGTPEANVGLFCELARQSAALFKEHGLVKKELVNSR